MIRARLKELEKKFGSKPFVVITEKVIRLASTFVLLFIYEVFDIYVCISIHNTLIYLSTLQDYDRDPEILKQLYPFKTFVLCSTLKILPYRGNNEDSFKKFLKDHLKLEFSAAD
jgi:tetraacyldisaccharide 4'-kinase